MMPGQSGLEFTQENKDKIDMIIGSFFRFFINIVLIGCYNITLCNNITFTSQGLNEF